MNIMLDSIASWPNYEKFIFMRSPSSFSRSNHDDNDEEKEDFSLSAIELAHLFVSEQIGMQIVAEHWGFLGRDVCERKKDIHPIVWLSQQSEIFLERHFWLFTTKIM